ARCRLYPFTHTRPVADIRCGILTMRERWERVLEAPSATCTETYLQELFPLSVSADPLFVNAALFATRGLADAAMSLKPGNALVQGGVVLAARLTDVPELSFETLP